MLSPGSQPFRASQRCRCSSDRRKTIVLQVKTMSSHQRRAGTTKWTSSSRPRNADESQAILDELGLTGEFWRLT